jgi:hypothetical protein
VIYPVGFVSEIRPRATSTINYRPRTHARLVGLRLLASRLKAIYVTSLRIESDELLAQSIDCREIPVGSFPFDPGDGDRLRAFELHWLPTRVIVPGGPGITLEIVNDSPDVMRHVLTRFIWEELD